MPRKNLHSLLASVAACLLAAGVAAQSYPDRPIKLVVPYPPGGSTDPVARLLAADVATRLSQPVVVDNKPGAAGSIGTEFVAKAAPDGHTLLLHTSVIATDPTFKKTLPYSVKQDLAPITLTVNGPYLLVVNPTLPAKNVAELIAYAKANPGKLTYASSGNGSLQHATGAMLEQQAGIQMTHIPYKGTGPALQDLLGAQVDLTFGTPPPFMPHIASGKLHALAVTGSTRVASLPDIPTTAEAGLPKLNPTSWFAVFAPAATPKPVIDKLAAEIGRVMATPEFKKKAADLGAAADYLSPAQLGELAQTDLARWAEVAKASKIVAD